MKKKKKKLLMDKLKEIEGIILEENPKVNYISMCCLDGTHSIYVNEDEKEILNIFMLKGEDKIYEI